MEGKNFLRSMNEYLYTDQHEASGAERDTEMCTNGVCFTLEVTEYSINQLSEADWLITVDELKRPKLSHHRSYRSL
jgi:hypothetical protein